MNKKMIDLMVLGLTAFVLLGVVGYARPMVISPIDGFETSNGSVLFSFSKADIIVIDDNPEFSSPTKIYAEDNLIVSLQPGDYYWKISGLMDSKVNTLKVESKIDLRMKENGDNYELVNSGNVPLEVQIYNGSLIQGKVILEVDESSNESGTVFIGRENNA